MGCGRSLDLTVTAPLRVHIFPRRVVPFCRLTTMSLFIKDLPLDAAPICADLA
jgi:hypothetical protein